MLNGTPPKDKGLTWYTVKLALGTAATDGVAVAVATARRAIDMLKLYPVISMHYSVIN